MNAIFAPGPHLVGFAKGAACEQDKEIALRALLYSELYHETCLFSAHYAKDSEQMAETIATLWEQFVEKGLDEKANVARYKECYDYLTEKGCEKGVKAFCQKVPQVIHKRHAEIFEKMLAKRKDCQERSLTVIRQLSPRDSLEKLYQRLLSSLRVLQHVPAPGENDKLPYVSFKALLVSLLNQAALVKPPPFTDIGKIFVLTYNARHFFQFPSDRSIEELKLLSFFHRDPTVLADVTKVISKTELKDDILEAVYSLHLLQKAQKEENLNLLSSDNLFKTLLENKEKLGSLIIEFEPSIAPLACLKGTVLLHQKQFVKVRELLEKFLSDKQTIPITEEYEPLFSHWFKGSIRQFGSLKNLIVYLLIKNERKLNNTTKEINSK